MLFNDRGSARSPVTLAISQPAHAPVSGRILGAWAEPLHEPTLLAAAQHDVAWLDWEVSPTFDLATGRPHSFRDVGAALHAPMWERGVDRAHAAWGRRVALLVSRHGSTTYERFGDRHGSTGAEAKTEDDRAAQDYLRRHRPLHPRRPRRPRRGAGDAARAALARALKRRGRSSPTLEGADAACESLLQGLREWVPGAALLRAKLTRLVFVHARPPSCAGEVNGSGRPNRP